MNSDTKYQAHVHALNVFQERNGVGGGEAPVREAVVLHPPRVRAEAAAERDGMDGWTVII